MTSEWMLWFAFGGMAVALLFRMMRIRQLTLIALLKSHIDQQTQWQRRRAKSAALASRLMANPVEKSE